jgi:deoxyadenosine/deoxycytidine kinase
MKNIVITGNIGAGKSTLVNKISGILPNSLILEEPVGENPYLNDFYSKLKLFSENNKSNANDMSKISLTMQLFLHYYRLTQQFQIKNLICYDYIIQDRYLYDQLVFSQVMLKQGIISLKDFNLFRDIFDATYNITKEIDILIYLKVSPHILMNRIAERNRECEKDITLDYITELNKKYNNMFEHKLSHIKNQYTIDYDNISDDIFNNIINIIQ